MIKTITLILYLMSDLHPAPVLQQIPVDSYETCIEKGSTMVRNTIDTAPADVNFVTAFGCEIKVQKSI